ncbi:MAG: hypothetical protein JWR37_5663 [Mycobacterium sp.]|nr:hypothetical protein [Mycobacterium sp.]
MDHEHRHTKTAMRHDQHTNRVRTTGSGSKHSINNLDRSQELAAASFATARESADVLYRGCQPRVIVS